jgi:hypothetical protein
VAVVASARTGGALLLGLYGEGSTLRYSEVAAAIGPMVRCMYVDEERSAAGGREIWAVPKERMTLRWRGGERTEVDAYDSTGALLLRARWAAPRVRLPLVCAVPFVGTLGGQLRLAWLVGGSLCGPVRVELDVPEGSPVSALGLGRRQPGLAGRLNVIVTRPRILR